MEVSLGGNIQFLSMALLVHDTLAEMNPQYPEPGFDPVEYRLDMLGLKRLAEPSTSSLGFSYPFRFDHCWEIHQIVP